MAWLDDLKADLYKKGQTQQMRNASDWFVRKIRSMSSGVSSSDVLRDPQRSAMDTAMGRMYFFAYDPKTKDKLPYYDTFPLIFIIEEYPDGFLGLNLHYLNVRDRAMLLNRLVQYRNNSKYDQTTRLRMSYRTISAVAKMDIAKPCIKRYLFNHVKSRFIEINADEWIIATFLPVENFVGASKSKVHRDSRNMF